VEMRFSAAVQTGSGIHPASCTVGTGSFPGVKWPGRGVDQTSSYSTPVKEGKRYISTPPLGLRGLF
jgi:hypothetical protein